jgi:phosphoglycolate phosphatase-like HAD superfamily hydrolase
VITNLKLLAVDSDGCVIDSMTEKHVRCFTPALIETWNLQSVHDEAMALALDINLYGSTRGLNRFAALALFFEKLPGVISEKISLISLPNTEPLRRWLAGTTALSESALASDLPKAPSPILSQALEWSREVNRRVKELPPGKPFAAAVDALREVHRRGIAIHVVSSANRAALKDEWSKANLLEIVDRLGSQEDGTKAALLREAVEVYGHDSVLMVGDAEGDAEAAQAAGVAYFRIRAGEENESWQELLSLIVN